MQGFYKACQYTYTANATATNQHAKINPVRCHSLLHPIDVSILKPNNYYQIFNVIRKLFYFDVGTDGPVSFRILAKKTIPSRLKPY